MRKNAGHTGIRALPEEERPREKMVRCGAQSLTNAELIGIIIQNGSKEATAVELGRRVLNYFDQDLTSFFNTSIEELQRNAALKGIGTAKACQLKAALELGRRLNFGRAKLNKIACPGDVYDLLRGEMAWLPEEHFRVLLMDTKNRIIRTEEISIGTVSASLVHPREVYVKAIRHQASAIIAVHNHPSGETTPSQEDVRITRRLAESGQLLGIPLLDHIIVGSETYTSLKEQGLL
ncbi:MAG: DNA repair protein RadC [Eubacterium sp.]|nr:DNA repair protein RadC [Eubacterium sp.]